MNSWPLARAALTVGVLEPLSSSGFGKGTTSVVPQLQQNERGISRWGLLLASKNSFSAAC
jgi:hypothetical protein